MDLPMASAQTPIVPSTQQWSRGWLKPVDVGLRRLLDIGVALIGLLLLTPIFALIAILIKRDSPGPVFYWGSRMGRNSKPFHILKFRTMYERPQSYDGPKITGNGDGRITPIGQWLRDTKLNELPQLWNVLCGEMSLVGPRPEDPDFVTKWPEETRRELLAVRPGITSPASVLYRDEEALLSADNVIADYLRDILPSKLRLDLLYVRHRSVFNDLDVIFWTVVTLLPRLKQKRVPEHSLFWGPLSRFITRHFSWFVTDLFVALAAVSMAGLIWRSGQPLDIGFKAAVLIAVAIAFGFSAVNLLLRLHQVYWSKAPADAVFDLALSCALATMSLILMNHYAVSRPLLPGGMLLVSGQFAFLGFVFVRYRTRILTGAATRWLKWRPQTIGERVLVIGAGEAADFATWLLRKDNFARGLPQTFSLIGMVDDAPRKQNARVSDLPVLGCTDDIPTLVHQYDIGLLLFSIVDIDAESKQRILALCQGAGVKVVMVPSILETLRLHFTTDETSAADVMVKANGVAKRRHLQQGLDEVERLLQAKAVDAAQEKVHELRQVLE